MRATCALVVTVLVGCSGGADAPEPAEAPTPEPAASAPALPRPAGPLEIPEWFEVDEDGANVQMTITAGATSEQNYWNFNGYLDGAISIVVPLGATVTIDFVNEDPVMPHSLGISRETKSFMMPPPASPVFEGAITSEPTSMTGSTLSGERETIVFVADEAGEYSMVCYIAGHSAVGMWVFFEVSADGEAGVRGP